MPEGRPTPREGPVRTLGADEAAEVVAVLAASFADYPALRYVLGDPPDRARRLHRLLEFFVRARLLRGEPILGIGPAGGLQATALVSYPGRVESPPAMAEAREALWADLGSEARARYETFGRAAQSFAMDAPHVHLNLLGVLPSAQGRGLARRMLEAVHALSADTPWSQGVTLTTEVEANVPLYEHFGYRVVGRMEVDGAFTSWGMARRDFGGGRDVGARP